MEFQQRHDPLRKWEMYNAMLIRLLQTQLFLFAISTFGFTEASTNPGLPVSGVNNVAFHQSEYNNAFAGNGFLIEYQNKPYAVTVKHALLEAKTNVMDSVSLQEHVSRWRIHPLRSPDKYVQLGRLINASKVEKLDMNILKKDWLLFEIESNQSDLVTLKIRTRPLAPGENVFAIGCSYANKTHCIQDRYKGKFISYDTHNLRVTLDGLPMSQLRGLSGSPVLDKDNYLVGIVSNVLPKTSGKGFDFAPAKLDYLLSILPK